MAYYYNSKNISEEYLCDESRFKGFASGLVILENTEELLPVLNQATDEGHSVTVQGARTGLTGGCVPLGGLVVSFTACKRILSMGYEAKTSVFTVEVEPGLSLYEFQEALTCKNFAMEGWSQEAKDVYKEFKQSGPYFFAPDPTENSASLGGMAACNASGARSFYYGPMRKHVLGLGLTLIDGRTVKLRRANIFSQGRAFRLPLDDGSILEGLLPSYEWRDLKNASGYYTKDNLDLLDLFLGQEGTLAIITSLTLALLPLDGVEMAACFFFQDEASALSFVEEIRSARLKPDSKLLALEYFDRQALAIAKNLAGGIHGYNFPHQGYVIYLELSGPSEEELLSQIEDWANAWEHRLAFSDAVWLATSSKEFNRLRSLRHAIPEAINRLVAERIRSEPGVTKLATDFAVPNEHLKSLVSLYRKTLDATDINYVLFGHIGNNHLHANLIPKDIQQYRRGKEYLQQIAQEVIALGGSVSAEHGIGKLKKDLLRFMYGEEGLVQMKRLKSIFDPGFRLNQGNLF